MHCISSYICLFTFLHTYLCFFMYAFSYFLQFSGTEDYDAQLNPSTGTLDNSTRQTCFNLTIVDDNLVEGRETLVVQLTVTQVEGSFSLEGMHRTVVTILDNDGNYKI